jgi:hypothetical protein
MHPPCRSAEAGERVSKVRSPWTVPVSQRCLTGTSASASRAAGASPTDGLRRSYGDKTVLAGIDLPSAEGMIFSARPLK